MQLGDFVKGKPESDGQYGCTNSKMTRGVGEKTIKVKILEHEESGIKNIHLIWENL